MKAPQITDHEERKAQFKSTKDAYSAARAEERKRIADRLKAQPGFSNVKGNAENYMIKNYTSGHTLDPHYDNSNWKWITGSCGGIEFLLSLQTFDIDPSSHNLHVLFDRLGLYLYQSKKPKAIPIEKKYTLDGKAVSVADCFVRMKKTRFELPLSEEEIDRLADFIREEAARSSPQN